MRFVLDTTFIIDHLRGVPAAIAWLERAMATGDPVYVTEIVVCEAWTGANSDDDRWLLGLLEPLEVVAPGPEQARIAGRWRVTARAGGRTLGLGDALIAATAHSLDAAVLTRNTRDFRLTPVRVETY